MKYLLPITILGVLMITSVLFLMHWSADRPTQSQTEAQHVVEDPPSAPVLSTPASEPGVSDVQREPAEPSGTLRTESDLCLLEPYEEWKDIPPCDAFSTGYYYDGAACRAMTLGCFGVFPFETLEECRLECE